MACTTIAKGKGVCGTAWDRNQAVVVPDVDQFPGHIACSSLSRSELVIPLHANGHVVAVLDVDSLQINDFSDMDIEALRPMLQVLQSAWRGCGDDGRRAEDSGDEGS